MVNNSLNKETQKRFNGIAENFEKVSNLYSVKRRYESLKINSTGLLLEVGSGPSFIAKYFQGKVICSDVSFNMCKQAKILQPLVVCCDAEMLPFRGKTFDAIISAEMIHYLQNPENFISYSSKILRDDGKLLISLANSEMAIIPKIRSALRALGLKGMYFDDGSPKLIKLQHLKSLLKKNGFKIESIKKVVIYPFESLDKLNRFLEKTMLNHFCILTIIRANLETIKT